jgi:hypothetical protein
VPVWCEDEAGPFQAIPQPGASWEPTGVPVRQPHEFIRGGTAKLLTLFRPATGLVRGEPVERTTNAILHPWLKRELAAILADTPRGEGAGEHWQAWDTWGYAPERLARYTDTPAPAIRLLLVLDNLAGHYTRDWVAWCLEHGIALLYTPLGGSWLNLAESVQRILKRRALDGQHHETAAAVMEALTAVIRGWDRAPTPFAWHGKRWERRRRARERHHRVGGARGHTCRPLVRHGLRYASRAATYAAARDK